MYRALGVPASLARMEATRICLFACLGWFALADCAAPSTAAPLSPSASPSACSVMCVSPQPAPDGTAGPTVAEARAFVDDVDAQLRKLWAFRDRVSWVNENFITDDTEALAAQGEERTAAYVGEAIRQSRRFQPIAAELPSDVARKLYLLSVAQTIPAPSDEAPRSELAEIETWMSDSYGKSKYCPPDGSPLLTLAILAKPSTKNTTAGRADRCLTLDDLSRVLAQSRDVKVLKEAWEGWHSISVPMKPRYARYVDLANEGAKSIGFSDVGALWRAGYDMSAADFEADIERLWAQVKPLYDALH